MLWQAATTSVDQCMQAMAITTLCKAALWARIRVLSHWGVVDRVNTLRSALPRPCPAIGLALRHQNTCHPDGTDEPRAAMKVRLA